MELTKEDYQRWQTDPITKIILTYLKDYQQSLVERNKHFFVNGVHLSEKEFYRDSERLITLNEIANLEFENIEGFYDTASVGTSGSEAD